MEGLGRVRDLAVGDGLTCVCDDAAVVRCWGFAGFGQGSPEGLARPLVIAVPPCAQVVAGAHYACALDTRGGVMCWGQTPMGDPALSVVGRRDESGFHGDAMRIDGLPRLHRIAAGAHHACGVDEAGRTFCWGSNQEGQLSAGARRGSTVEVPVDRARLVAAGDDGSCVVDAPSSVTCWGADPARPCVVECPVDDDLQNACARPDLRVVPLDAPALQLALGDRRACALAPNGALSCWGRPWGLPVHAPDERVEPPAVVAERVVAVAIAGSGGCLLQSAGPPRCWGHLAPDAGAHAPPGLRVQLP